MERNSGACFAHAATWNQRGLTLLELLVTVAIIAIFLGYAIPSYQDVTVQDRMAAEIDDLTGAVQLARSAAVKQGIEVTICASADPTANPPACVSGSSDWSGGWIVFTDIANNKTFSSSSGDVLLQTHAGLKGNDVLTGTAGTQGAFAGALAALTFNRMGGTSDFGALTLNDAKNKLSRRRCSVVSLAGTTHLYTQSLNPGVCP